VNGRIGAPEAAHTFVDQHTSDAQVAKVEHECVDPRGAPEGEHGVAADVRACVGERDDEGVVEDVDARPIRMDVLRRQDARKRTQHCWGRHREAWHVEQLVAFLDNAVASVYLAGVSIGRRSPLAQ
jgi:hypothetical protein